MTWPYLTDKTVSIAGVFRDRFEDFVVEEIPLYTPSGSGDHLFVWVEKKGVSTDQLVRRLSRELDIPIRNIGYAGKKDRRAISRQWLSLGRMDAGRVKALDIPGVRFLDTGLHRNKLRLGHLKGNRFEIVLRQAACEAAEIGMKLLDVLKVKGVPNYFGPQRFGIYGKNAAMGHAIIQDRPRAFFAYMILAGTPTATQANQNPEPDDPVQRARMSYEKGQYEEALSLWPKEDVYGQAALRSLVRGHGDFDTALAFLPGFIKRFCLNALQSYWFNQSLADRLPQIDRVFKGDLAYLHRNGAVFRVVDESAEQNRVLDFEISPSGPIWGDRMTLPEDRVLDSERRVLALSGISVGDVRLIARKHKLRGQRRAYRVGLDLLAYHWFNDTISLVFELPAGCYATSVLREMMKANLNEHEVTVPLLEKTETE